jgi:hypothetical protein
MAKDGVAFSGVNDCSRVRYGKTGAVCYSVGGQTPLRVFVALVDGAGKVRFLL